MLRLSSGYLTKRTPGYVFWRQSTLVELEHAKRNYLLSERPVSIAEIARRMMRVKSRYESTDDYHERNLLRGEYKYFTGKLCDIRAARLGDMIAYLRCASFFGFWDTAQVERVMAELLLRMEELRAEEMVPLFACLPGLRQTKSDLFTRLAEELVDVVPDLTAEECLQLCETCDSSAPTALMHNLLTALDAEVPHLTPSQLVVILDMAGAAPQAVHRHFKSVLERITHMSVERCESLDAMEVAVLFTTLNVLGNGSEEAERRVLSAFVSLASGGCARSIAMMCSSVFDALSNALWFAQAMEERVVFLATDFTSTELLAVLRMYLHCFTSMCLLSEPGEAIAPSGGATGTSNCLPVAELRSALQRQSSLRHVLSELSDQLVVLLESATAYLSPANQLDLLALYATAVEDLAGCASPAEVLQRHVPQTRIVLRHIGVKIIAHLRHCAWAELMQLLSLCNTLGMNLVEDAVVTAAIQELLKRDVHISGQDAADAVKLICSLTGLRAAHQVKLNAALMPKLRHAM